MKKLVSIAICICMIIGLVSCSDIESESSLPENQMYSLDGMSVTDIEDLLTRLSDVSTGDLLADYPNRFDVQPYRSVEQTCSYFFYVDNQNEGISYIQGISLSAQIEMDGTITVIEDRENTNPASYNSYIEVVMILTDYDTAVSLYDYADGLPLDYTIHYAPTNRNRHDNRDGLEWTSNVYGFIQRMNKVGDNYEVRLQLPISSYLRSRS